MNGNSAVQRFLPHLGVLLVGVIIFLLPNIGPTGKVLSLATTTVIFAVGGAGLGFLWGQAGQLTLAHAAVFGLGAYTAAICGKMLGTTFVEALPLSILVGAISGGLVALPSLRTKGHYFVILTFAIGEVLAVIEQRWDSLTGGANGILITAGRQTVLGFTLMRRAEYYQLTVIFLTVVSLLLLILTRSRWGTILRGMRENADLAASLGVNIAKQRLIAFAIAGAIAGLAGQLYVYQVQFIAPSSFTTQTSIMFLLVTLLGGKAYLFGPAVGALAYFFLPELFGLPPITNQIAFGALLVLMILLAPEGLLSVIGRTRRFFSRMRTRSRMTHELEAREAAAEKGGQS